MVVTARFELVQVLKQQLRSGDSEVMPIRRSRMRAINKCPVLKSRQPHEPVVIHGYCVFLPKRLERSVDIIAPAGNPDMNSDF